MRICTRCIYDERVPGINFDEQGVCNYCHQKDKLEKQYGTGTEEGERKLNEIVEKIKRIGAGNRYDCVVGVSGGTDSSYLIYLLVRKYGLRPLAVTYDNTWGEPVANQNMEKVLDALNVDLETYAVDPKEADDIFKAFFLSGVPELEASTDMAIAEVLYRAANRHGIKYTLDGHSFVAEGITPLGVNYFDGKYIKSVHKRFGRLPMETYPLLTFNRFLYWSCSARIKRIRPFWYINYSKSHARKVLEQEFGWEYYGGHHLENKMTKFAQSVYLPQKFNTDERNNQLSGEVRIGVKTREEALVEYNTLPKVDDVIEYFKKRLGFVDLVYDFIMNEPPSHWTEYPTYKKRFEVLRPLFYVLVKFNLVPMSFYLKYCFPVNGK
jgi:N-acetyl sugar amidotransferase